MDIGGYTIDNKYVAAGAAGLGILFLVARNRTQTPSNVATLQPGNGLTWADVIGQPDSGLIGGTGESGGAGPPGPPGPAGPPGGGSDGGGGGGKTCVQNGGVCQKNNDCCARHVCVDDICVPPPTKGTGGGGGGGGNGGGTGGGGPHDGGGGTGGGGGPKAGPGSCQTNDDCRKNQKCRRNICVERTPGGSSNNPTNPHNLRPPQQGNNRPAMPSQRDNPIRRGMTNDPSQRSPRDQATRDQGDNRVFRENINGNRVTLINRGGNDRERGRDANANASGGSFNRGDINGPGRTRINVSGGRAVANASGGNGNVQGPAARRIVRTAFGRGGEVLSNDSTYNGYGRMDGAGNQSSDAINLQPQSGGIISSFSPLPVPMQPTGATTTVQKGESLRGVAQRVYGYDHFVPRLYQLNQDLLIGRTTLEAGTVLKI